MKKKFGTVINCMDGRAQIPVITYLQKKYQIEYIDSITEAGPVKTASDKNSLSDHQSLKSRLAISIDVHDSVFVAITAHHDCAGNPVSHEKQIEELKEAVVNIKELVKKEIPVIALWLNEQFEVCEIES